MVGERVGFARTRALEKTAGILGNHGFRSRMVVAAGAKCRQALARLFGQRWSDKGGGGSDSGIAALPGLREASDGP